MHHTQVNNHTELNAFEPDPTSECILLLKAIDGLFKITVTAQ